jgi:hypothetical protein
VLYPLSYEGVGLRITPGRAVPGSGV